MVYGESALEEELLRHLRDLTSARLAAAVAGDHVRARALGRERRFHLELLRQSLASRRHAA